MLALGRERASEAGDLRVASGELLVLRLELRVLGGEVPGGGGGAALDRRPEARDLLLLHCALGLQPGLELLHFLGIGGGLLLCGDAL